MTYSTTQIRNNQPSEPASTSPKLNQEMPLKPFKHIIRAPRRQPAPNPERATSSTKSNSYAKMSQLNTTTMCIESSSTHMKVLDQTSSQRPKTYMPTKVPPRKWKTHFPPSPDSTHGLMPLLREETVSTSLRIPRWSTDHYIRVKIAVNVNYRDLMIINII